MHVAHLLVALFLGQMPAGSPPMDAPTVYRTASPSVVVVHALDAKGEQIALGSGVVVGRSTVATNAHVIDAAARVVLSQGARTWKVASVVRYPSRDVAVLRVEQLDLAPAATGA